MFEEARRGLPAVSRPHDAKLLREALAAGPGAPTATLLERVEPESLDGHDRVDLVRAWEAQAAWTAARAYAAIATVTGSEPLVGPDDVRSDDVPEISVESEIAAALRISPRTAGTRIATARFLASAGGAAAPLLESGRWSFGHVRAVEDELTGVAPGVVASVLTEVVTRSLAGADGAPPQYADETPSRLRARVRRTLARIDARARSRRIQSRHRERSCTLTPQPDFRGQVTVDGPYPMLAWAHRQLDTWARRERDRLRAGAPAGDADVDTSLEALRADAFVEAAHLLAREMGDETGVEPRRTRGRTWSTAVVVLDAPTALGMAEEPGFVPGYGWVPAPIARDLLGSATRWRRFLTDAGRLVDVGRTTYRPSDALRELVSSRDLTCTFPGCSVPSADADLDHVVNFDGTNTTEANLRPDCRSHHRLKTFGRWQVRIDGSGRTVWTSPSGQRHRQQPDPLWGAAPERAGPVGRIDLRDQVEVPPWWHGPGGPTVSVLEAVLRAA